MLIDEKRREGREVGKVGEGRKVEEEECEGEGKSLAAF